MVNPGSIFKNRSKPRTVKTKYKKEDKTEIEIDWLVKPLSPRLMVQNYKYFAALEEMDKEKAKDQELSREEEIETLEKLAPLIDVVLPHCCVNPKIVMEGETNDKQVCIDDMDVESLMALFSAIFESSGLSKAAEAERTNLEKPPSQKQSQPSA